MQSSNLKLARRYLGALWSHGHLMAVPEIVAPSCTVHDALVGDYVGRDALTAHVRELRRAFPDLMWTIDDVLADAGNQLALTWTARGTHRGPLAGIAATRRGVQVSGMLLLRIEEGQLIAITARWNPYELFHQLTAPIAPHAPVESELDALWDLGAG